MSQGNIYKPRYKVAFQAKSKIWPYKNSRLRRFFNIRGRKLVRRGLFKRYFLVFNNMKWTIARRYIRPYMKKRRPLRRRFRNVFYSKQQLRAFYGKQKETAFRNFFKKFLGGAKGRNNMFAVALERRADVFLFRLRVLPTIYACHQFIHHMGVDINGKKEKSPYALVRPGDIVTFDKAQWGPFVEYLYERLYWRVYGLNVWKRRQFKSLRKKVWWCYKNKFFKKSNVFLLKKYGYVLRRVLRVNNSFSHYLATLYKEIKAIESRAKLNGSSETKVAVFTHLKRNVLHYWKEYRSTSLLLLKKINRLYKKKWRLKLWSWRNYYAQYYILIATILRLYKTLKFYFSKFKLIELDVYKNAISLNVNQNWKEDLLFYKNLKEITENKINNLNREGLFYKIKLEVLTKKVNFNKKELARLTLRYRFFLWKTINSGIKFTGNNLKLKNYFFNYITQLKKRTKIMEHELETISQTYSTVTHDVHNVAIKFNGQTQLLNKNIKDKIVAKENLFSIINAQSQIIENRFENFNKKLELILNFIIKRRIKRYALKSRVIVNEETGKKIVQKSPLIYFLTKRRMKKERRFAIPRLKKVHWYVPSYIYFDTRTLRAVFLYNPKPEEIVYSFKCSLKGLHSFYRSLGI